MASFRVGITPDFYVDAQGRFEAALASTRGPVQGVIYQPMPAQPGDIATANALDQFGGIFPLALKVNGESLQNCQRLALIARWGVGGYDMIDADALTAAGVALAITPIDSADPLLVLDNVILSPHGLAWTEEIVRDNGVEACANLLQVARGEAPAGLVNRDVLHHPGFQQKLARYRESFLRSTP